MRDLSFAVLESALHLLRAADPWTKQLLGEPGLAEEETESYRRKLEAALLAWIALNATLSVSDEVALSAGLTDLYNDLDALARQEFPRAFRMGFGAGSGVAQAIALAAALNINSGFLISSLIPYLSTDLTDPEAAGQTLGQVAEQRGSAWGSRIGLYGGSYWTAIWLGVQESLRETLDTETVPVRRLLDPGAQHCNTCPPKAREYGSWNEMLALTGGLPADGSDQCHSNCFPAGIVVDGPKPIASFERRYSGPLIEITTVLGNELTCTPNHPILTPGGWIAAQFLQKGTNLISCRGTERMIDWNDPDEHQIPALIEQVVGSFRGSPSMNSVQMGSTQDFHGDGTDSEIYVVRADRLLRDRIEVTPLHPSFQSEFGFRSPLSAEPLFSLSTSIFDSERIFHSSSSFMGGSRVPSVEPMRSCSCHQLIGFGLASPINFSFDQHTRQSSTRYAIPSSKSILRYTSGIASDEIIQIRRTPPFHGMVFNLETKPGWYIANGIIVHNCRCQIQLFLDEEWIPVA